MAYNVTHLTGEMESEFDLGRLATLLAELENADSEHAEISVTHESGWSLSVYRSRVVVLECLEHGEPVHLGPLDRNERLRLMTAIAEGRIDEARSGAWLPDYP